MGISQRTIVTERVTKFHYCDKVINVKEKLSKRIREEKPSNNKGEGNKKKSNY